jgi:hypothetical protein
MVLSSHSKHSRQTSSPTTQCPDSNQPPLVFANQAKKIRPIWGASLLAQLNWLGQ